MQFLKKRMELVQKEVESNRFTTAAQKKEEMEKRTLDTLVDFIDETRLKTDLLWKDKEKREKKKEREEYRAEILGIRK
jgi:tRNA A37 threonylcarbamoyladenosine dehydratase